MSSLNIQFALIQQKEEKTTTNNNPTILVQLSATFEIIQLGRREIHFASRGGKKATTSCGIPMKY